MSSELVWGKNPRIIKKTGKSYSKPQCPKCSYSSWFWSNEEPAWLQAESKKLPPVEKAIDSGIASGATMEGLDLALGAEEICLACNSVNQDPETHAYCETCRVKCVVCGELLDENTDGENYENKICGTVSCYEEAGIIPEWMGNSYYANDYLQEFPPKVLEEYGYDNPCDCGDEDECEHCSYEWRAESFSAEDFDAETERWIRIPHNDPEDYFGPYYGKGYGKKRIFPNEQEARRDYEKLLREEPESGWWEDNIGVECGCGNFVLREAGVWNHGSDTRSWGYSNYPNQVFSQNVHYDRDKEEPTSEEWEFATRWKEGEKNIVEVEYATKDRLEFERITYMPMKMLEAEDEREHPSVYWFVKGEIMERQREQGKMTENDLAEIVEIVATKAPLWMIDKGMREAEKLGDRGPWEILKMSAINRIILEEMDDDAVFSEKLGGFQAEMEIKTELCLHCGEKATETCDLCDEKECKECFEEHLVECNHCEGTGEVPRSWVSDSGDRWNPPSLDVTDYEPCEYCDEGQVCADEYVPQFSWDADTYRLGHRITCGCGSSDDVIPCSNCNDNICGGHRCGSCGNCNTSDCCECSHTQAAESNGDKQLDLAVKRTKMSALRTGLALTTFGIVLWNLWTNKKQEKQISDIMGLV
jgi:hypothetical protein